MATSERATSVSAVVATHSARVVPSRRVASGCSHGTDGGDLPGQQVEVEERGDGVGRPVRVRRRHQAREGVDPAVADLEVGAVDMGGEGGDAATRGQCAEAVLGRAEPLAAVVDHGAGPRATSVSTRPPTRSRASTTTTSSPAATRPRAACSPAYPAPATTT